MPKKKQKSKNQGLFGFLYEKRSFQLITLAELVLFSIGIGCSLMIFSKTVGYIVLALSIVLIVYKFGVAYQRRKQK